jgi:fluoroquinolone resistance protein
METLPLFSPGDNDWAVAGEIFENQMFANQERKEGQFVNLEFYKCIFKKCKFIGSIFQKCRFEDCDFIECDLSLIKPRYSSFFDVKFENCKLVGVNWTEAATPLRVNFYSCTINLSTFDGLNLKKITMTKCIAKEVNFIEADLSGGNFNSTDFAGSRFLKTNLAQSDFRQATNYSIDPTKNFLKKTKFSLPEAVSFLSWLDIVLD